MRILIFSTLLLALVACKEKKEEVIDLSDITAQSKKYAGDDTSDSTNSDTLSFEDIALNELELSKNGLKLVNPRKTDTLLFVDRFQFNKKTTFLYDLSEDSVLYSKWNFSDSSKTQNVFLNWINFFSVRGKSIRVGEKTNMQKSGFVLFANDTCLVYVGSNNKTELEKWKKHYTTKKNQSWKYVLTQGQNGKVNWQSYSDKKWSIVEDNLYSFD